MARPIKRKVTIVLRSRESGDPLQLLTIVEKVYRPGELEIIDERGDDDIPIVPNERLETEAREAADEALEAKDEVAKREGTTAVPTGGPDRQVERAGRLKRWSLTGWRIVLKVLPVAERVAKIYKEFE